MKVTIKLSKFSVRLFKDIRIFDKIIDLLLVLKKSIKYVFLCVLTKKVTLLVRLKYIS